LEKNSEHSLKLKKVLKVMDKERKIKKREALDEDTKAEIKQKDKKHMQEGKKPT
jgi:hypothetical protein